MKRSLILLAAALVLSACSTVPEVAPPLPPPAPTSAMIDGTAAYVTDAGRKISCAGLSVALMADDAKTRARILALYGSTSHAIQPVSVVKARSANLESGAPAINSAGCNDRGQFVFDDVQPGVYFLIAHVRHLPVAAVPNDLVILQRVSVRPGEARQIRLAP